MYEPAPISSRSTFFECGDHRLATSRIVGERYQSLEQLSKGLEQALIMKTEQPYEPHISDWDEWEPPSYVSVYEQGEIVGYYRRNPEIEVLGMETGA